MRKKIGWIGINVGVVISIIGVAAIDSTGVAFNIAVAMTLGGILIGWLFKEIGGIDLSEYEEMEEK